MKHLIQIILVSIVMLGGATLASADHSWGGYHWQKSGPALNLAVGDSVTAGWDQYLDLAVSEWSASSVIDLMKTAGANIARPKQCRPVPGRIEVCNAKYGSTGWLGIAQIWLSGGHITQGVSKMNDTYFTQAYYNTSAWKRLVMCQEVAHDFGLDHQDEEFANANLGSCMDYTDDPDGGAGGASETDPANVSPNTHDYVQLEAIYNHVEGNAQTTSPVATNAADSSDWGRAVAKDASGKDNLFERDLGNGQKLVTHVFWIEERAR